MSQVCSTMWYDNGWWCTCPWCGEFIEVSDADNMLFNNNCSMYIVCPNEECGNSFYLEKQ